MHSNHIIRRLSRPSNINKLDHLSSQTRNMSLFFPSHRNQRFMNSFVTPYNHTPIPRSYPQLFSSFDDAFRELTKWADESHRLFGDLGNLLFAPKFNVKETDDLYQFEGELPGVKQTDLTVEFIDDTTLKVQGRMESIREEGTKPSATVEDKTTSQMSGAIQPPKDQQTSTETSTATENDKVSAIPTESAQSTTESTTEAQHSPSQPAEAEIQVTKTETTIPSQTQPQTETHWISERTIGTFQRTFSFPAKSIDHDAVKASLKDGVLSIIVPKLKNEKVESRKVEISFDSA